MQPHWEEAVWAGLDSAEGDWVGRGHGPAPIHPVVRGEKGTASPDSTGGKGARPALIQLGQGGTASPIQPGREKGV